MQDKIAKCVTLCPYVSVIPPSCRIFPNPELFSQIPTSSIWHFIWSPTLRVPSTAPTWSTYPPCTWTLVTENSTSCNRKCTQYKRQLRLEFTNATGVSFNWLTSNQDQSSLNVNHNWCDHCNEPTRDPDQICVTIVKHRTNPWTVDTGLYTICTGH